MLQHKGVFELLEGLANYDAMTQRLGISVPNRFTLYRETTDQFTVFIYQISK